MSNLFCTQIIEKLNALIVIANEQGDIKYVSPSAEILLGYDIPSLLGDGLWKLTGNYIHDYTEIKSEIVRVFSKSKNSGSWSFERAMTSSNGLTKWILWNISVSEEKNYVGIGQDIALRKRMELQLLEKNKALQLKNAQIIDSIRYARRIQYSVLQDPETLKQYFKEVFILLKPRDYVSGDFYWYHKKSNKIFVAAIDCTGHGVPGAILSVIAHGLISNIIIKQGLENPGEILHTIEKELRLALSKENSSFTSSDGMDIGLAIFDFDKSIVEFSGAHRPLIIIRDSQLLDFRGNKFPIGQYCSKKKLFETVSIPILKDDKIYLFSDGFVDQFGGEKGKKLNRRCFYKLLTSTPDLNMEEQCAYLEYTLNKWKQDEPQTDDILIIGLKV